MHQKNHIPFAVYYLMIILIYFIKIFLSLCLIIKIVLTNPSQYQPLDQFEQIETKGIIPIIPQTPENLSCLLWLTTALPTTQVTRPATSQQPAHHRHLKQKLHQRLAHLAHQPLHEGQQLVRHLHLHRQQPVPLRLLHLHLLLPPPRHPQSRLWHSALQRYIFPHAGNDYLGQEYWEIRQTARTATTFSVEIQIFGVTNLWILSVGYLAVDPTFPHHLNSFDNVPINYTAGNIANISDKSSSMKFYVNTINYTAQAAGKQFTQFTTPYSQNYIVIFMTSLWIAGSFGTLLQFHIYPQVLNSSHYRWNITLYKNVRVTNVHYSQIIFNSEDVKASQKYFIVFSRWFTDGTEAFLPIPIQFVDNFIMGVHSFEVTDAACGFEYQWEFRNQTVSGVEQFGVFMLKSITVNNRCGFSWAESTIFYMMTWSCLSPSIFFNLTTGNCQTGCGGFSTENTVTNTCDVCTNPTCYQCEGDINSCSYCASYLFYQLQGNKCVCFPRYFQTDSSCKPCHFGSTGCINCTYDDGASGTLAYNSALFACIQCNKTQNYFLTGSLCTLCTLSNCVFCQNLTHCGVCQTGYDYSDAQTCLICNVVGCTNCSATNVNICTTCNNTMGYYNNASTNKCSPKCGDAIYVTAEEGCDDGNLINYDGCSSSCIIEPAFSCSGQPSVCYFASSVSFSIDSQVKQSQICNTITFNIRFNPPSDTFAQPYITWDNFITSPNDSLLIKNNTMSSYSGGILSISYFLMGHLQNETLIFNSDFSTIFNTSHIFLYTSAAPLSFTVDTTPEALMICCRGYYMAYNPLRCEQICGDAILFILACDDGNIIDGDGCDMNCSIEEPYVCVNGTADTPSICSYNGSFGYMVESAFKDPLRNSMNITYVVSPFDPWLVLNNGSTDFSSLVSFPGREAGITITSAVMDPDTGYLVIQLDYSQHLQDQQIKLQITPPDIPQAFLVQNQIIPWTVQTTNQLAVVAYTQDDYQTMRKMSTWGNAITGFYLAIVLLTCVFRKFIGLEMATLVQLGYLSLIQNPEITVFQQPISDWGFVFGYNRLHFTSPPQERLNSPYHILGYLKLFGFSNNIMILAPMAFYLLSAIFLLVSIITSKSTHRKFKIAAFTIANEIAYMLVVFSTPNIVTAICIQAQQDTILETSPIWSKGMLIGAVLMLIVAHFLNLSTAQDNSDVGTFFRKYSQTGVYAPILFSIRLVVITTLLFVYHITPTLPGYFIIIVQLGYTLFVLFGRPHKKLFDLFRAICIQMGLLYIFIMRFLEIKILADYVDFESNLYQLIAFIEYGVYSLGAGMSLASFIYHIVKRVKGNRVQNQYKPKKQTPIPVVPTYMDQSTDKLSPDTSKRGMVKGKPVVFDVEDVNPFDSVPGTSAPGTSVISLDSRQFISPRRNRNRNRNRARRWE